jgi:DNA-binding CsgD family transcriptional regulator
VDKSLVVADESGSRTRYRLLETMRQYALEKLGESGEADVVRTRHRDYYTAMAAMLDEPAGSDYEQRVEQAQAEIDNLRAAFAWSREDSDVELSLALACSLQPLWQARGRLREGLNWFDTALADLDAHPVGVTPKVQARALADRAVLATWMSEPNTLDEAQRALAIARDVDDTALLARALTACGYIAAYNSAETAAAYFAEAIGPARASGDRWSLSQILASQAAGAILAGDPSAARAPAQEGRDLADAIGDRFVSRRCRGALAIALLNQGNVAEAVAQFREVAAEAEAARDEILRLDGLAFQSMALAFQGDTDAARAAADAAIQAAAELGGFKPGYAYVALGSAALAAGDGAGARDATEAAWQHLGGLSILPANAQITRIFGAQAALATGDLIAARRWADDAIATSTGYRRELALTARARVAIAEGEPEQAERNAHDALEIGASVQAYLGVPDILECLAVLAGDADSHREATRLFGAAAAMRQRMGMVRFKVYDAGYEDSVTALRDAMSENDFDAAWAEGAALSTEGAIAYAQRGRGQRKRPASGWGSLTPTELDVVRLVSEGLSNNDAAARLFISPRTVQTHLTHVYTKLSLTSRVQLVQEAARHA